MNNPKETIMMMEMLLQSNGKRAKKEEIQWTEQKEYVLVCAYKSEKAYMKGKKEDLKLEIRLKL